MLIYQPNKKYRKLLSPYIKQWPGFYYISPFLARLILKENNILLNLT